MTLTRLAACAASVAAALFLRCAGPAHQIMPGYAKVDISDDTLGVILVKRNLVLAPHDEIARILGGGDAVQLYYDFFGSEFPELLGTRSGFKKIEFLRGADDNMRSRADGPGDLGSGGALSLPAGRNFVDRKYRYLLILDVCSFQRERYAGAAVIGAEGGFTGLGGGLDNAKQSLSFVMWDNARATIAAYGIVKEKIPTGGDLTKQTLLDLMKNLAVSINRGMPYRR
ncbi:MAG: hypothetical protein JXA71_08065 [Chitinispirillaceae bacterium]|nr:hypothetical protein [Chitinispirillaceae bacterium]